MDSGTGPKGASASRQAVPPPAARSALIQSGPASAAGGYRLRRGAGRGEAGPGEVGPDQPPAAGGSSAWGRGAGSGSLVHRLLQAREEPRRGAQPPAGEFQRRGDDPGGVSGAGRHYLTPLFVFLVFSHRRLDIRHELRTVPHGHERSENAFCHPTHE